MKLDHSLTASYTTIEPNTYLMVTTDEALLLDYCTQVYERNRIPGLLPLHLQSIDGDTRLCFDITGKRKLTSTAKGQKLSKAQGEHILRSLISGFHQLPEYFLRSGMCLLDLDYLFVDSHLDTFLPLLPLSIAPEQSGEELREFFLSLLGQCFTSEQADPYFDRMIKYLIQPGFSLERLEELAIPQLSTPQRPTPPPVAAAPMPTPAAPTPPSPSVSSPVLPGRKKEPEAPEAPDPGFAIPGGGSIPVPTKKGKAKAAEAPAPTPKDQSGFLSGLFGKKKQVPDAAPKLDMKKEAHILSGAAPQTPPPSAGFSGFSTAPQMDPSWEGTVALEDLSERTVFLEQPVHLGPTLLCQGRQIQLTAFPFSIGKVECSLNLNNSKVSRLHATILCQDGAYYIQDEGSTNHTYVNGVILPPYTPYQLGKSSTIVLANEELHFEAGDCQ